MTPKKIPIECSTISLKSKLNSKSQKNPNVLKGLREYFLNVSPPLSMRSSSGTSRGSDT
jgi:hypothetical protein